MRFRLLAAAALMLLGGCTGRSTPRPDPAHAAMLRQIDAFLPTAEAQAAQCRYQPDRRMLDTYLGGLRTLRRSPAGGVELATQTMRWFDETWRDCRRRMTIGG